MDIVGAQQLRRRIEEQRHWAEAPAVRDGSQPGADPHAPELEDIVDGTRLYGRETAHERVEGRHALVTRRMTKRVVEGRWTTSYELERVDDVQPRAS